MHTAIAAMSTTAPAVTPPAMAAMLTPPDADCGCAGGAVRSADKSLTLSTVTSCDLMVACIYMTAFTCTDINLGVATPPHIAAMLTPPQAGYGCARAL